MRNKNIRVAVAGAMLVLSIGTAAQARPARPAGAVRGVPFFAQLGELLVAWTEDLFGLAPEGVSGPSAKTASPGTSTSAPRTAEATSSSTDRSAAIDPWGVR